MKHTDTFDPSAATPNLSKFGVSGGVAGLITTGVFVTIALIGLPIARGFLIGAVLVGGGIAAGLRLAHRD